MKKTFIIDAHQDLAYESLYGGFNYLNSVAESRRTYQGPEKFRTTIGWPEYQKAGLGIVIGTIFLDPKKGEASPLNGKVSWSTYEDFHSAVMREMDFYDAWQEKHPDKFRLIDSREYFRKTVSEWENRSDDPEKTHPVGIIRSLEGAEGLRSFEDLELYHSRGLRLVGPVWGGGRWCDGTRSETNSGFTPEGYQLLRKMESLGLVLDISHMKNRSAQDAMSTWQGTVIASHANCNALLKGIPVERHLNDDTIRMLAEHDGVMGVIPFNAFLSMDWWDRSDLPRDSVTLDTLTDHIDHICQLLGDSDHVALGTDSDGGFGYPAIPYEMNDISDLPKLAEPLQRRGYTETDIEKIFCGNWQRVLERALP